jgi:S-adenosylmethionine:tRNA ribosyltransferase-isomerase
MLVSDFDFDLPQELIAQAPLAERDASRLLCLPRTAGLPEHRMVRDLPGLLREGDVLVVNDARVIPARLRGRKRGSGGKVELLLIEPLAPLPGNTLAPSAEWLALGQASKALKAGQVVEVRGRTAEHALEVVEARGGGELRVRLPASLLGDGSPEALFDFLEENGELPLPPYIERAPEASDRERYQTLFARVRGAVAAPTAGLHFTEALLGEVRARGAALEKVTLHVGPGTFLPVRSERVEEHAMHRERYEVPQQTVEACAQARAKGGRIIAVGTTALRTLEAAWDDEACRLREGPGSTALFCTPGYRFRAVDALFTNFHLPQSTLLMLVSAFAGRERTLAAYREAVERRYRFFSYGDAMFIA